MALKQIDMKDYQERRKKIQACEKHVDEAAKKKCLEESATVKPNYKVLINPIIFLVVGLIVLYIIYLMIR